MFQQRSESKVKRKDYDDLDLDLIEEINRKYEEGESDFKSDHAALSRVRRIILSVIALMVALIFLVTVTGRWLHVFTGPALSFLQESWVLSDDPLVQESRQAVVQVYVNSSSAAPRGMRRGSGFNIAPEGLIITNRHLVEDASVIRVSFPGRGTFIGENWHSSEHVDLAVINIAGEDLPTVPLAAKRAQPGEELLIIGNPLQFARIANKGTLIGYSKRPADRKVPFLIVEAAIYPGSSGSPIFNDLGEVVGVIFATLRNSDPSEVRGLAVDVREIEIILEEISADKGEKMFVD